MEELDMGEFKPAAMAVVTGGEVRLKGIEFEPAFSICSPWI